MSDEKRNLYRIKQRFSHDVQAYVVTGDITVEAKVVDYQSISVRIRLDSKLPERINALYIHLGSERIGSIEEPKILRSNAGSREMVISLTEKNEQTIEERPSRVVVNKTHQGFLMGFDPLKLREAIYFHLVNVSLDGVRIHSSKSNRHLLPGLMLQGFDLMLPGLGAYKIDLQIINSQNVPSGIEFGCRFVASTDDGFKHALRKYLLLNSTFDLRKDREQLRSLIAGQRDYGPLIRMIEVHNEKQFEEVLKTRQLAYQAANKISQEVSWESLKDQYDPNSVNFAVLVGQTVVGTLRIVYSKDGSSYPFEEYLKWDDVPAFGKMKRDEVVEISRLAIDPLFQGSDIFITVYRNIIVELGLRGIRNPVCIATPDLATYYQGIGAVPISATVKHKVLEGGTMRLYMFSGERMLNADMNALGWFKVVQPALKFLSKYGLIRNPSRGISKLLRLPFEAMLFVWLKRKRRNEKRKAKKAA